MNTTTRQPQQETRPRLRRCEKAIASKRWEVTEQTRRAANVEVPHHDSPPLLYRDVEPNSPQLTVDRLETEYPR